MHILLFIPHLSQEGGGVRQYATALLGILAGDPTNKYFVLGNDQDPDVKKIIEVAKNIYLIPAHIGKERKYEKLITDIIKGLNLLIRLKFGRGKYLNWSYLNRICKKYSIDLVHTPFQSVPYCKAKVIWTCHDFQELHFPEYFLPIERENRARGANDSMLRGAHIIVSYNHIKNDIIKYFQVDEIKITVCLLDMQELWFNRLSKKDIDRAFQESLPKQFILYPANTWAHKNHVGLLEALKIVKSKGYGDLVAVFTGHKNRYYSAVIEPFIQKNQLENNVQFLGIVSDRQLYTLYKSATACVIPTKYEAGSFPLMESIMLNVPVICSQVTSLPETIGDSSFTFDPDNYEEIADRVVQLISDDDYVERNKMNSILQAEKLKNQKALNVLSNVYRKVYES